MVSKKVFKICFSKKGLLRWSHLPPSFFLQIQTLRYKDKKKTDTASVFFYRKTFFRNYYWHRA